MKAFLTLLVLLFSLNSFAQKATVVNAKVVDLGDMRGMNKFVLKINPQSPEQFKIVFNYKYNFESQEIGEVFVGAGGSLGFSTRTSYSETYENKQKILIDLSESSVVKEGEELELVLDINRPNKNMHGLKILVTLKDAKGNRIEGGKKLLGLLGRSYSIISDCP